MMKQDHYAVEAHCIPEQTSNDAGRFQDLQIEQAHVRRSVSGFIAAFGQCLAL